MQHCNKCNVDKPIDEFVKGHKTFCLSCMRSYGKEYRKQNKAIIKERQKEWYETTGKFLKIEYDKSRLREVAERDRKRYVEDTQFRLSKVLRTRLYKTIKGTKTSTSMIAFMDMDLALFRQWIEYQFDDVMSWDNYATYWEIDHFQPCSSFNLDTDDDKYLCFHWSNMRPLVKDLNMKKSNSIPTGAECVKHKRLIYNFMSFNEGTKLKW